MLEPILVCSGPFCGQSVHNACCTHLVLNKSNDKLTGMPLGPVEGTQFCAKDCYSKYVKSFDNASLGWNNDGKNGLF